MRRTPCNDGWKVRRKANRFLEMAGASAEWEQVTLPHDAMIGTERSATASGANAYFPGGVWEYERTLEVPAEDEGMALALAFEGVYRDVLVHVNREFAGHRPYGYSELVVPIDHLLRYGAENTLRVEARAFEDTRWYSGAGIHRNVWLLRAGRVHLAPDELVVRTPEVDDEVAIVTVGTVVRNQSATRSEAVLRTELLDDGGRVVAVEESPVTTFPGDELATFQRLTVAEPQRWGVDHPTLYTCRMTLLAGDEVLDEDATPFGIRTLSLDPRRGLRINGERIDLRGACVHHDNGPIGAATIDRAEKRRVELLKAAGFNAIRSAHNPMSRAMLDACDRLGVVVMDETFDMWSQPKSDHDYSLRFADWWKADTEAMVRKDRNHPSVVFYSIGNEVPDASTDVGVHQGRAMTEAIRALDGTRFVTQAVSGILSTPGVFDDVQDLAEEAQVDDDSGVNTAMTKMFGALSRVMASPKVTEATAEMTTYLDAAGYNYMDARFEMDRDLFPNRVIVASETHPATMADGWAGVTRHSHVVGDFTWTGWDYLGEAGIGRVVYADQPMSGFSGEHPWVAAWCGDIDITGQRRPQSFYREIVFGLRADPYLAVRRPEHHGKEISYASPWSWSDVVSSWSWDGHEGAPVVVEVYADADEVELLVNGRSLGRKPAGAARRFRAHFDTTYEPGTVEAVAWRDGKELGRTGLRSASGPVQLAVSADRTSIAADPTDLAFVEIDLVDDAGTICTKADRLVRVEVDGPGVLQGLASANPKTDEPFVDAEQTTFDGRALAVVRPTGAGAITVTVSADGCAAQEVRVSAIRPDQGARSPRQAR